jgi:SNF2 family DNA or RNA helicase
MLRPVRSLAQSVVDGILADAVSTLSLKAAMTAYTKELMARATEAAKPVSHETTKGGPLVRPRPAISYLPHQETGIRWMLDREAPDAAFCRGGILGDDMGLGKTFQTIGLIKNSLPCKTLILCPPALLAGWTEELKACALPVSGLTHLRDAGTVVATYNIAHLHATDFRAAKFDRVILDEGHIIRNGKATKRWWTCMAIARKSPCRWILSATPVQNGAKDWINLCTWLKTKARPAQMPDLASVIMLRRTMVDIRADPVLAASVPPEPTFIRHGLSIPEGTEEGKLFRTLTDRLDTLMDTRHVSALLVLELYMRIQQFLVHPQLYIDSMRSKLKGAYHTPDWTGTATKFQAFTKVLQESDEPTIVFCNFRAEMDRVRDHAISQGWKVWSIRGGMGSEAIGQAVQEAKNLKNHNDDLLKRGLKGGSAPLQGRGRPCSPLIIVQIVAGGAGLNLQFCSRILFLSQHWNPAVVHQACGRAVRIGQNSSVHIHFFSIDDPVALNLDARMAQLHSTKISDAKSICSTLFIGFPHLIETE